MAIPDYQTVMLPLLKFLGDQEVHHIREVVEHISNEYALTEEERDQLLPSGKQTVIKSRVGWARTYLKMAGLVEDPKRGYVNITQEGLDVLKLNPDKIDTNFLEKFPGFGEFRARRREVVSDGEDFISVDSITGTIEVGLEVNPEELMEAGFSTINDSLEQELLDKLRRNHWSFFEHVVLELLSRMDYGEGEVIGQPGDGGVDGFINQDKLGLDRIFFQAKRFAENTPVTASMIRDFVGGLDIKGVNKGVFITTSRFPNNTESIISRSSKNIVLIDGNRLVELMIKYDIAVKTEKTYDIKRIDSDFFPEE